MALTTTARAKRHASLSQANAAHLLALLEAATNLIELYCNRTFDSTAYATEDYDGDGAVDMYIKSPPITAFTSIVVTDSGGDTETILAAEFDVNEETGYIKFSGTATSGYTYFPTGIQNIAVTYTGGYVAVPDAVQEACIQTAMWLYDTGRVANSALKSERLGEYSYTLKDGGSGAGGLPKAAQLLLGPYRIHYV